MEIKHKNQLNNGVGKYKVLSSNAGVGSIVTSKWGGFIMPKSVSDWEFVKNITKRITDYKTKRNALPLMQDVNDYAEQNGVQLINDERFVEFLRNNESLTSLMCLVGVPHMNLDRNNKCDIDNNPIVKRVKQSYGIRLDASNLVIPSIIFPRWFYSKKKRCLYPIEEWKQIWVTDTCNNGNVDFFAPPRDPYAKTMRPLYEKNDDKRVYEPLEQLAMALICPNGHISDIPWDKYFEAKLDNENPLKKEDFNLFNYQKPHSCNHKLQLLDDPNNPESFGRLYCTECKKSVSLEGIMNLRTICAGEKPWEEGSKKDSCEEKMRWTMVTSNSVYYAENFSSLYIPSQYLRVDQINQSDPTPPTDDQKAILNILEYAYGAYKAVYANRNKTRKDFTEDICEFNNALMGNGYSLLYDEREEIIQYFLLDDPTSIVETSREDYRLKEYEVFNGHSSLNDPDNYLSFSDIDLPDNFSSFFNKIQQVDKLTITSVQLSFSRVQMPQLTRRGGDIAYDHTPMKIFKESPDELLVLPAIQVAGEGIFFSFNQAAVNEWEEKTKEQYMARYKNIAAHDSIYNNVYQKMNRYGDAKFYMLHTFSHIVMKQLEFTCGYPVSSLKERLYFSDKMCGVLIYTADGSEGSMGGLVWQGQKDIIRKIVVGALKNALDCASDPICWEAENTAQLNYAACFSCAMVSETACEERNVGLDRYTLVHKDNGFFASLIYKNN